MSEALKIAIIGDYNFTYNSHLATNMALDHSGNFLEVDINYYWIKINEAAQNKLQYFEQFDGILIAPGPFTNAFFLNGIIRAISTLTLPVLITGESLKNFIEVLINSHQLNSSGEKLISDNLVEGNTFERIQVVPHSKEFILYWMGYFSINDFNKGNLIEWRKCGTIILKIQCINIDCSYSGFLNKRKRMLVSTAIVE